MGARTMVRLLKENKVIPDRRWDMCFVYNSKLYEKTNKQEELRVEDVHIKRRDPEDSKDQPETATC